MIRVVVVGATGLLGRSLVSVLPDRGHAVTGLGSKEIDLESGTGLDRIGVVGPDIVVNAAAWTDVDGCARDPDRALRINGEGAGRVAAASGRGATVIQISTNEVFDGGSRRAYAEDDAPNPINAYGRSKLAGETAVVEAAHHSVIVRTAWLFDATTGFPARIRRAAAQAAEQGQPLPVVEDEWGNPTPASALAHAIADLVALIRSERAPDILHLAGEPSTTRLAWAQTVVASSDITLVPISRADFVRPSTVPEHAVLSIRRAQSLGLAPIHWQEAAPA